MEWFNCLTQCHAERSTERSTELTPKSHVEGLFRHPFYDGTPK